jgi:glycosyltransferase involved in cell wall biosynthesis
MTSFNAASTIEAAATSVLSQSLSNLELWIVDDVSTDGTIEIARSLAERDPRVRVLLNEQNIGTYASKNRALRLTDAEYVALHDSDDWKHPKKLELQLAALEGGKACSISNWIRMDANGEVYVRRGGPYTHLNPASTFMPRSLLQNTGFFDEVRTGADAEFLTRIRNSVGWSNVIDTGKTLAIGLHHEASLTTSGATAFDEHRYSPVRLEYTEAWLEWQLQKLEAGEQVKLEPFSRPFVVPSSILATNIIG